MAVSGVLQQEVTFMVQHGGRVGLDGIEVSFDDERAVANAGIAVVATLAQRLGVEGSSRTASISGIDLAPGRRARRRCP